MNVSKLLESDFITGTFLDVAEDFDKSTAALYRQVVAEAIEAYGLTAPDPAFQEQYEREFAFGIAAGALEMLAALRGGNDE